MNQIKKSFILFSLFSFLFSLSLFCSKNSTQPETVTFSGKVTLEGRTDHSGVKVMLFEPVKIDTALTNLNNMYPGGGLEINQTTEFFWKEHMPIAETITDKNGNWKIDIKKEGPFHLVVKKEEYGWRCFYNIIERKHNVFLKKVIKLNNIIENNINIENNNFIKVISDINILNNIVLKINSGCIIEFYNNSKIIVNGKLVLNGEPDKILITTGDNSITSKIKILGTTNLNVYNTIFKGLKKGLYIRDSDSINISYSCFKDFDIAIDIFNSKNVFIKNNLIINGINGVVENLSNTKYLKNFIYNIENIGINSISPQNCIVDKCILKKCSNMGLAINYSGYAFTENNILIQKNDFIKNNIDVYIGRESKCSAKFNNFLLTGNYIVKTNNFSNLDTLQFIMNYWGTTDIEKINSFILDINDGNGMMLIQYIPFLLSYINNYI